DCTCKRFVEIWNLVFTQFNRVGENDLKPLPNKNIDTGMGLERITAVMQSARTNFDTDLFIPIIKKIKELELTGLFSEGIDEKKRKVIADHLRAAVFAIAEGLLPSNEDRGYVIRKLIRRAYIGALEPFLFKIVPVIIELMGNVYPELIERYENIVFVIKEEEERFEETLSVGLPRLKDIMDNNIEHKKIQGKDLFKLVDTYGLPLEVIEQISKKQGYSIDIEGFDILMKQAKELSRKGSNIENNIFVESIFSKAPDTQLSDKDTENIHIAFIVKDGKIVDKANKEDQVAIITSPQCTSFYKESGGQTGDTGTIKDENTCVEIKNTVLSENKIVHICVIKNGEIKTGQKMIIERDCQRNKKIACNHTATHLLQSALRQVLGERVKQSGSAVDENRLRFDFTYTKKMTQEQLQQVEEIVNRNIKASVCVEKKVMDKEKAREEGAIALFGEKYGDKVRVVTIGDCSKEFCGGSHVDNTKDIGLFKIINESSIASGIRRIEAITGNEVIEDVRRNYDRMLGDLAKLQEQSKEMSLDVARFKADLFSELEGFVNILEKSIKEGTVSFVQLEEFYYAIYPKYEKIKADILKEQKKSEKQNKKTSHEDFDEYIADVLLASPFCTNDIDVFCKKLDKCNMNVLRSIADEVRGKHPKRLYVLLSESEGKANMIVTYSYDLKGKNINASEIVKKLCDYIDGSGGGRPDFAQAGGKDPKGIDKVIANAKDIISEMLNK
ncbi:MAG: alanine--tRNA ligase, partial [Candidatus Omnitrophica bacterium]|nr:alanine--tRNA ligase [Candidatus Omnitrophota bacterium]